jgi:hypothetical protein
VRVAGRKLVAMSHPIQCRCGTLKGHVSRSHGANRCVCYCRDCQAFAHFLGRAGEILDSNGGTDVVQTRAANVVFTEGREALACMRSDSSCAFDAIGHCLGDSEATDSPETVNRIRPCSTTESCVKTLQSRT